MQGAQRTHCTLCEKLSYLCREEESGRLQSQRTVNARSNVGSRAADSSRFSGHFSGCLHTNTTSHSIAASVTTAIPRKDGKHALEATSDCGAYTTECDTYASRHARKSSFVYPGLHGTAFGKHCKLADCATVHLRHAERSTLAITKLCASLRAWTGGLLFRRLSFRSNLHTEWILSLVHLDVWSGEAHGQTH